MSEPAQADACQYPGGSAFANRNGKAIRSQMQTCTIQLLEAYAAIPIRMAGIDLKQAVELSARLNVYAYDAYVLACAMNQGTPLLTLDGGLKERARELKLDVLEAETR